MRHVGTGGVTCSQAGESQARRLRAEMKPRREDTMSKADDKRAVELMRLEHVQRELYSTHRSSGFSNEGRDLVVGQFVECGAGGERQVMP